MSSSAAESFTTLARRGSAVLADLRAQLDAELAALQRQDLDALRGSTDAKQHLLAQFSEINRERTALLSGCGIEASGAAVSTWLNSLPEPQRPVADEAWQQLQQDLEEISRLNLRNEQVIVRNSRNNEQLLNLLRGQNPAQTLYNATGTKGPAAAQKRIGKA
ncbi:hypothetical protein GCM10011348_32130 [Marinobacterium nitratireducens]|uniref:Flagellar biosynthesis protein FlgN n=1 Tax=Marinobacterium nitratireducens TaxID=518897 RepID=A0A917ZLS1_9GAMM|nr:flagellar protein FlgN [Marinobacterium nitratireducens]GGO84879.1 hypothetical protein GCM10011348_32130 [Marinobacterium nitratireducens]